MAKMTHLQAAQLSLDSKDLVKYDDLVYTKLQIKHHMLHGVHGLLSFNKVVDKSLINHRVLDCIPEELQQEI